MLAKGSFLSIFLRLGGWRQVVSVDVARSATTSGGRKFGRVSGARFKSACLGIGLAAGNERGLFYFVRFTLPRIVGVVYIYILCKTLISPC